MAKANALQKIESHKKLCRIMQNLTHDKIHAIEDKVKRLEKILLIKDAIQNTDDGLLYNKTFLVTGKLNGISRAEVKSLIEKNSGKTISSVSKKLNFLIIGEKPTKKKVDYAKELKIKVIDQAEFLKMLNKTS